MATRAPRRPTRTSVSSTELLGLLDGAAQQLDRDALEHTFRLEEPVLSATERLLHGLVSRLHQRIESDVGTEGLRTVAERQELCRHVENLVRTTRDQVLATARKNLTLKVTRRMFDLLEDAGTRLDALLGAIAAPAAPGAPEHVRSEARACTSVLEVLAQWEEELCSIVQVRAPEQLPVLQQRVRDLRRTLAPARTEPARYTDEAAAELVQRARSVLASVTDGAAMLCLADQTPDLQARCAVHAARLESLLTTLQQPRGDGSPAAARVVAATDELLQLVQAQGEDGIRALDWGIALRSLEQQLLAGLRAIEPGAATDTSALDSRIIDGTIVLQALGAGALAEAAMERLPAAVSTGVEPEAAPAERPAEEPSPLPLTRAHWEHTTRVLAPLLPGMLRDELAGFPTNTDALVRRAQATSEQLVGLASLLPEGVLTARAQLRGIMELLAEELQAVLDLAPVEPLRTLVRATLHGWIVHFTRELGRVVLLPGHRADPNGYTRTVPGECAAGHIIHRDYLADVASYALTRVQDEAPARDGAALTDLLADLHAVLDAQCPIEGLYAPAELERVWGALAERVASAAAAFEASGSAQTAALLRDALEAERLDLDWDIELAATLTPPAAGAAADALHDAQRVLRETRMAAMQLSIRAGMSVHDRLRVTRGMGALFTRLLRATELAAADGAPATRAELLQRTRPEMIRAMEVLDAELHGTSVPPVLRALLHGEPIPATPDPSRGDVPVEFPGSAKTWRRLLGKLRPGALPSALQQLDDDPVGLFHLQRATAEQAEITLGQTPPDCTDGLTVSRTMEVGYTDMTEGLVQRFKRGSVRYTACLDTLGKLRSNLRALTLTLPQRLGRASVRLIQWQFDRTVQQATELLHAHEVPVAAEAIQRWAQVRRRAVLALVNQTPEEVDALEAPAPYQLDTATVRAMAAALPAVLDQALERAGVAPEEQDRARAAAAEPLSQLRDFAGVLRAGELSREQLRVVMSFLWGRTVTAIAAVNRASHAARDAVAEDLCRAFSEQLRLPAPIVLPVQLHLRIWQLARELDAALGVPNPDQPLIVPLSETLGSLSLPSEGALLRAELAGATAALERSVEPFGQVLEQRGAGHLRAPYAAGVRRVLDELAQLRFPDDPPPPVEVVAVPTLRVALEQLRGPRPPEAWLQASVQQLVSDSLDALASCASATPGTYSRQRLAELQRFVDGLQRRLARRAARELELDRRFDRAMEALTSEVALVRASTGDYGSWSLAELERVTGAVTRRLRDTLAHVSTPAELAALLACGSATPLTIERLQQLLLPAYARRTEDDPPVPLGDDEHAKIRRYLARGHRDAPVADLINDLLYGGLRVRTAESIRAFRNGTLPRAPAPVQAAADEPVEAPAPAAPVVGDAPAALAAEQLRGTNERLAASEAELVLAHVELDASARQAAELTTTDTLLAERLQALLEAIGAEATDVRATSADAFAALLTGVRAQLVELRRHSELVRTQLGPAQKELASLRRELAELKQRRRAGLPHELDQEVSRLAEVERTQLVTQHELAVQLLHLEIRGYQQLVEELERRYVEAPAGDPEAFIPLGERSERVLASISRQIADAQAVIGDLEEELERTTIERDSLRTAVHAQATAVAAARTRVATLEQQVATPAPAVAAAEPAQAESAEDARSSDDRERGAQLRTAWVDAAQALCDAHDALRAEEEALVETLDRANELRFTAKQRLEGDAPELAGCIAASVGARMGELPPAQARAAYVALADAVARAIAAWESERAPLAAALARAREQRAQLVRRLETADVTLATFDRAARLAGLPAPADAVVARARTVAGDTYWSRQQVDARLAARVGELEQAASPLAPSHEVELQQRLAAQQLALLPAEPPPAAAAPAAPEEVRGSPEARQRTVYELLCCVALELTGSDRQIVSSSVPSMLQVLLQLGRIDAVERQQLVEPLQQEVERSGLRVDRSSRKLWEEAEELWLILPPTNLHERVKLTRRGTQLLDGLLAKHQLDRSGVRTAYEACRQAYDAKVREWKDGRRGAART